MRQGGQRETAGSGACGSSHVTTHPLETKGNAAWTQHSLGRGPEQLQRDLASEANHSRVHHASEAGAAASTRSHTSLRRAVTADLHAGPLTKVTRCPVYR